MPAPRQPLARRFDEVRAHSLALAASLSAEDQGLQSMPDASPTKWHLAHTSWFFEAVVLRIFQPSYQPFDEQFFYLFNSYYEALGPRHPRPQRGLLSRPSLAQVLAYRSHVEDAVRQFIARCDEALWRQAEPLLVLGLHHEQQHQELIQTDILHALHSNPLLPAYQPLTAPALHVATAAPASEWVGFAGGAAQVGHPAPARPGLPGAGGAGDNACTHALADFAFDNEMPRHTVWLAPYQLASHLVSCGEYARFIADGGYRRPEFWLSDGWAMVQAQGWQAPLYWHEQTSPTGTRWQVYGRHGLQPLDPAAPVSQVSFYEAAAYAAWAGARLPTEFEWEAAFGHPALRQMLGHVWQWTRSSYDPYPGFQPAAGAVGEYNGKFMVGQLVLRGSSSATPPDHARASYRNFFPPAARWQFSGLRLAKDTPAS